MSLLSLINALSTSYEYSFEKAIRVRASAEKLVLGREGGRLNVSKSERVDMQRIQGFS